MAEKSSSSQEGPQLFGAIRHDRPRNNLMIPYARSRASSRSSIFEDVRSAKSDDLDDTLEMLAAEIKQRTYPSSVPIILEDSPGKLVHPDVSLMNVKLFETLSDRDSQTIVDTVMAIEEQISNPIQSTPSDLGNALPIADTPKDLEVQAIHERMDGMQTLVEKQFNAMAVQLKEGSDKQAQLVTASDNLVDSLRIALQALQVSQTRHETMLTQNESQLATLLQKNAELSTRNANLENAALNHHQTMIRQEERQNTLNQQAEGMHQQQMSQQYQLGRQEQSSMHLQQEFPLMRERNRDRPEIPSAQQFVPESMNQQTRPKLPPPRQIIPESGCREFGSREDATRTHSFPKNPPTLERGIESPYDVSTNSSLGYTPLPCVGFPNMVLDSCPTFTPTTFQNWKREVKLRIAGQPGASVTQLLAKLIHVLPLAVKTESLLYMEQTEKNPQTRTINHIMDLVDTRYGRTDSERACSWLTAFTEFKRETHENYKDFWARFTRCVTKLDALGMPMNDKIVFNRAIHALRLPEGQLPIVLSALETRPDRFSVTGLREITIRMYETHKMGGDSSEVYNTATQPPADSQQTFHAEWGYGGENDWSWEEEESDLIHDPEATEIILEDGSIMLMKPKKPNKPRNTPGSNESARRGAVKTFSHIPNRKGKGNAKSVCLRCGDPSHHWKDCPHPIREKLDPRFPTKGKGKTFTVEDIAGPASGITCPSQTRDAPPPAGESESNDANPSNPGGEVTPDRAPQASLNDVWAQYYAQNDPTSPIGINVCETIHINVPIQGIRKGGKVSATNHTPAPPPILIDSGASCSVVGEAWLCSWGKELRWPARKVSDRQFRFGDGPPFTSLGELALPITIPKERTSDGKNHVLWFRVDVVSAVVPLLISQQALTNMEGIMNFSSFTLQIPMRYTIQLQKSSTGHVLLPGIINQTALDLKHDNSICLFPIRQTNVALRVLADREITKIHIQLGHCSEKQLTDLLRFGGCKVDMTQIQRITTKCNCRRSVHRITPPVVSSWIARFSGEVVAIDILHPFTEIGPEGLFPLWKNTGKIAALLVVDSLTRFISCQILKALNSEVATQVFMNDWVKHFGKPKRIILDQGGPGLDGKEWEELSHIFGWQYIRAPVRTPHQNGLAERTVRSLKAAVQSIVQNENHSQPSQALLTLAVIAKNHAPHAVTGLPPAFAMTGRCDILSGSSTSIWEHDPMNHDSLIPQMNSLRKILEARNAIIQADSTHAIQT